MFENKDTQKYLDNASTTPVDSRVLDEMLPYFTKLYGNASSNHSYGQIAKKAIDKSRKQVSNLLNCFEDEIIFTSGSTEAINIALKGYIERNSEKGNHIITVKTEHKAVLNTCEYLETKGYNVTYLDVDINGLIDLNSLQDAITDKTVLICVMYVNNEIGVIQPIKEIGAIAKKNNVAFFCDATQAAGKLALDVEGDNIDMLCLSAHKLAGPKGIGALYKRNTINLTPLIHGGGQESGLRGGTLNTPGIVGLGMACYLAKKEFEENIQILNQKRLEVVEYYESNNIGTVNFKEVPTAPHIMSITLNEFEAEEYLIMKSREFIASTGSACNSEIIEVSHVLKAIDLKSPERVIRISV